MTTEARRPRARRSNATPATPEEVFLSHSMGAEKIVSRSVTNDGGIVTMTHEGSMKRVLYKPTTWGWESIEAPASNVVMLMQAGLQPYCGDCGGDCSPDPMNPTPNACPDREKFAISRCPVCRRIFHDFGARVVPEHMNLLMPQDEDEGPEINQDAYQLATPALRLKAVSDAHVIRYHPDEAVRLGLIPAEARK